jgi:hypothetical protein
MPPPVVPIDDDIREHVIEEACVEDALLEADDRL